MFDARPSMFQDPMVRGNVGLGLADCHKGGGPFGDDGLEDGDEVEDVSFPCFVLPVSSSSCAGSLPVILDLK